MGRSPLDLKPILLDLPFRPVSVPATAGSGLPACDPAANANVFIADPFTATVLRYYTCSQTTAAKIPVPGSPLQVAITPDAKLALVTNLTNSVTVIDSASNKVTATIALPAWVQTAGIAITPDGTRAYVTNYADSAQIDPAVYAIDIASRSVVATIPVGNYPQSVAITPDGSLAYVTLPTQSAVSVIDTLTNTVATSIRVTLPMAVAFNPTGTLAYITSGTVPGTVQVVDAITYNTVTSYAVGDVPVDVLVDPTNAGRWVVVLNRGSGSASEIDTQLGKVRSIKIGDTPHGLAWTR